MAPVKLSVALGINSMLWIVATVAPLIVVVTVEMAVGGNAIVVFAFQLVLFSTLCTILLYVLLFMAVAFIRMLSIRKLFI